MTVMMRIVKTHAQKRVLNLVPKITMSYSVGIAKNVTSTVSEENSVTEKVVANACPPLTIPPPTLPSSLMTRVRERLSTPSPAMV